MARKSSKPLVGKCIGLYYSQRIARQEQTTVPKHLQSALIITVIYMVFGGLWILFSDRAVNALISDADVLTHVQTLKGWLFILVTGALLFVLISNSVRRLESLHRIDPLTGLYRHYLFKQKLDVWLNQDDDDRQLVLLYADINEFEQLNRRIGHAQADGVLVQFSETLQSHYRQDVLLGRMGVDVFALAHWLPKKSNLDFTIQQFRQLLTEVDIGLDEGLNCTMGVAVAPTDGQDAKTLMSACATALTRAKSDHKGGTSFYNKAISRFDDERRMLASDLKRALEDGALSVVYQPQYHLQTGTVTGVEALVRWHDRKRGDVSPATFIPIAEEFGLSDQVTTFMLKRVAQELTDSNLFGKAITRCAINISATEFNTESHIISILKTLKEMPAIAPYLQLEITETAALQNIERSSNLLERFQALGVRISIDDFGTGYSSLAMLKSLPLDEIKIDRSFVFDMDRQTKSAAIVNAVVALAQAFNVSVVAEGIETDVHLSMLKNIGCPEGQGYFFYPPMPLAELADKITAPVSV